MVSTGINMTVLGDLCPLVSAFYLTSYSHKPEAVWSPDKVIFLPIDNYLFTTYYYWRQLLFIL